MPKIDVHGMNLAYEVFGEGPPIVWTSGGWLPRAERAYLLAGRLSVNYKVLVWYRRNSGASDIAIEDAPSEFYLWADDLHRLLNALNMSPAYLGGAAAGYILSLLMAHRYPEDVKGLILCDIGTDDPGIQKDWADAIYLQLAEVAESKGMQAVIEHSKHLELGWLAQTIQSNPGNRERVLAQDPEQFAAILRKWGDWFLSGRVHLSGLSDDEVSKIRAPTLILPGFDEWHPRHAAEILHGLLPNSELVEFSDHYSREKIDEVQESDSLGTQKAALSMQFFEEFLQRIEIK